MAAFPEVTVDALPGSFTPAELVALLSAEGVGTLVAAGDFVPARLRVFKDGLLLPDALYATAGRVDTDRVLALHAVGATVVVQDLERHWAPARDLVTRIAEGTGRVCNAVAFWTPPGQPGLDRHSDDHDVLVLQTAGSKAWEVHHPSGVEHRVLRAGEAMVIPEGVDHCARTLDEESLHVTVAMFDRG